MGNDRTGDFSFKPKIASRTKSGELEEPVLISEIAGQADTVKLRDMALRKCFCYVIWSFDHWSNFAE
jgi:hypothetical protein